DRTCANRRSRCLCPLLCGIRRCRSVDFVAHARSRRSRAENEGELASARDRSGADRTVYYHDRHRRDPMDSAAWTLLAQRLRTLAAALVIGRSLNIFCDLLAPRRLLLL